MMETHRHRNGGDKMKVFLLTFFSYVMLHVSRKSFSAVKGEMSKELFMESALFPSAEQGKMYGLMDTLFMVFYASGLYVSGVIGDRFDLRKLLAGGMFVTAAIMFVFGMSAFVGIRSLGLYASLWALNGLVQSIGWPVNVAVMGNWFNKQERGAVMGVWSANASFGNIVGTAVVALLYVAVPSKSVAWKSAVLVAGGLIAVQGWLVYAFLKPWPPKFGSDDVEEALLASRTSSDDVSTAASSDSRASRKQGISFWRAWRIPGVLLYALAYACLKSLNYALFFWLPFYLTLTLGMDDAKADLYSMLYDAGQMTGGFLGGYVTDKAGIRSPIVAVMIFTATGLLHLFQGASHAQTSVLLVATGFLLGGPANLISTAISADLGTHDSLRQDTMALSTVTGIIDGTGSVGAAIVQFLVGYLSNCHPVDDHTECTWGPVFMLLQVSGALSCVCLGPLVANEVKMLWQRRRGGRS
ncbi:hypothetical protein H310_07442 [Aphanomyces invadans]|uniref:Major facilitator superfamily (MFS) profile domain-containing protein n=1 Tax=Aphanomyces invadans TaxID=157072 RepID=A0A024U1B2_9STRA|nr:hypothetical protein H310_07442 [Aphanomyces invadans]ETV99994.1 hypothetical protein H310_07442 [Aphanomyces invadans]|eukprot:XP_008871412.1 hypothetical protein H310_07442 [Aphanomyces invadans]